MNKRVNYQAVGFKVDVPVSLFEYGTDKLIKHFPSISNAAQFLFKNKRFKNRILRHLDDLGDFIKQDKYEEKVYVRKTTDVNKLNKQP